MLGWLKAAIAALLAMFGAGVAWANVRARIAQTRRDLNGLGARVTESAKKQAEFEGRIEELRAQVAHIREQILEREATQRERAKGMEKDIEFVKEQLAAHLAREI
jgi:septal ring factor EnvC (AmiA/AmiB activator)